MATYSKRGYKAPKPKDEKEVDPIDNVSDQDSTTAEVFNTLDSGANKIEAWILKNQKYLFYTIGGLIIVDRKSTRLNSSHVKISYAVFCLKKKKKYTLKTLIKS